MDSIPAVTKKTFTKKVSLFYAISAAAHGAGMLKLAQNEEVIMPLRNSKVEYADTPDTRVLNLAKIGIPDVPVLSFVRYTRREAPIDPHRHKNCFEIGLCLRGYFILENNGAQHTIRAGGMFLNNPEDAHRMLDYPKGTILYNMNLLTENPKGRFLRFTQAESTEIRARLHQLPPQLTTNAKLIRHAFMELFRSYDTLQGRYRTLCMTLSCMSIVTRLLEPSRQETPPSHADRIGEVVAAMRQAPANLYDIDTLAHQAALSPSHFIIQFKRLTGLPPHHFLIMCRLDEAKLRLRNSRLSVTRIAHDLGFCSTSHFESHFKRATGMRPLAWRRQK